MTPFSRDPKGSATHRAPSLRRMQRMHCFPGAMPTPAPQRMVLANWHRAGMGMPGG
jgi:hypothetical protein